MGYEIVSYADCVEAFTTVRNPVQGKPLHGKGVRLFKDRDDSFRLTMHERTFARITKDDVITFTLDTGTFLSTVCTSLVYTMTRFLPLGVYRVGQGRYRIGYLVNYKYLKDLPEYFGGIQFNLETHQCINPRTDRHKNTDKEARKVWLKTLREYRMGVLSRLKLGVRSKGEYEYGLPQLAQWMKDGQYPDELFNYLCRYHNGSMGYEYLAAEFERTIDEHRNRLRSEFGVFLEYA